MKLTDYIVDRIDNKSKCPICEKWFSFRGLPSHFHRTHNEAAKEYFKNVGGWNKGLTKDTDDRIKRAAANTSKALKGKPGFKPSDEHRAKTSVAMKKAHAEGRAHNIGSSRWNNEPSYPEKFFMKVIENEFADKNYEREFPFSRFSLDFAWVEKKRCIEIDGEQHQRFEEYRLRDERKDKALQNAGWKVLRIKWADMYSDTKVWIETAKNFIE